MARKRTFYGVFILSVLALLGLIGYLVYGQSVVQSTDPVDAAVADAISPGLLLAALGLILLFLAGVVFFALRSGRPVRINRDGLHIGRRSK